MVFFGEPLPEEFPVVSQKIKEADLVLVMGTSLQVAPFNRLVHLAPNSVPKILINKENTQSINFQSSHKNRYFLQGDCDEMVQQLCHLMGWSSQLKALMDTY